MSENRTDSECVAKHSTDPFIIEFISATDIPFYDGKSKSDPFLQSYISSHVDKLDALNRRVFSLQRVSNLVQTPRRLDCTSVTWHCYRDFNVKPTTEALLTVELYHHNKDAQKGVPLGKIDIPVSRFQDEEPIKFPLYVVKGAAQGKNPNFSVTLRRVYLNAPAPLYRTFFLIRHGESKWNEAQAKINIGGMLDNDHPLTSDGINQACALSERWKLTKSQGKAKYAADRSARASMCSELIDFSKLDADDFVAMGEDDGEGYDSDAGSDGEGAHSWSRKAGGRGLGKLYDSIFQRYSNVTVTGKPRAPVTGTAGPGTGAGANAAPARSNGAVGASAGGDRQKSCVPSFLDSEILDFTSDSPPPAPEGIATAPLIDFLNDDAATPGPTAAWRPALPAVIDPFDLHDGYSADPQLTTTAVTTASSISGGAAAGGADDPLDGEGEGDGTEESRDSGDDLPQRREEYIRLFMRADIVYASPLTRAVQTAMAAMCGHPALTQNRLTLYSIIREIKRIGGLDTVGVEVGAGIMRRVKTEMQLAIGVARAHEISDFVKADINDADTPWWTSVSSFENDKEVLDRLREFITFSRYCEHNLPVFVGHSLFFKEFCSKRISAVMSRKRPHLSANLKHHRLSNASLLAVTVKYVDLDNGCSEAVIVDADLIFGGGFHGVKLASGAGGHEDKRNSTGVTGAGSREENDIDGAMRHPSPSHVKRISGKVSSGVTTGGKAIGRRMSQLATSLGGMFEKNNS